MLNFDLLGSRFLVTYKMHDNTVHKCDFDTFLDALSFKGSCTAFIRRGIIIDFCIREVPLAHIKQLMAV